MKDLLVIGSSYLLPNNNAWSYNLKEHNLFFGDYGDWQLIAKNKDSNKDTLLVLFLEDFLLKDISSTKDLEETLCPLISLLDRSASKFSNPVIIAVAIRQNFDVIRSAKGNLFISKAFNWLLKTLEDLAQKHKNLYIINLKEAFAEIGHLKAFDNRNWYFARCRLSVSGIRQIASCAEKILHRHYNPAAKVLALDCDNTIWGGIIGEDEIGGIVLGQDGLGQAFIEFQKEIKKLVKQGIIIVLLSKNNENDVWAVFNEHKSMQLNKGDITAWRINWREKHKNIRCIAEELSIGLESFVFWDDNPIEREKMRALVPEVETVGVPTEVHDWPYLLLNHTAFSKMTLTKEDLNKKDLYSKRAKFVQDSRNSGNAFEYLKSIKLSPKVCLFDSSNITRGSQLCSKTNQFNLRTERHSAQT